MSRHVSPRGPGWLVIQVAPHARARGGSGFVHLFASSNKRLVFYWQWEYYGILWNSMECYGMLWDVMGCYGISGNIMEYCGMLWGVMGYYGMLWDVMGYVAMLRDMLECCGILWRDELRIK